ncbi:YycH family regulatory protein [Metabacillus sp. 84]|uniref:YycH family regulatory protein n=1 Tax=Metabacillus sp. 84 TaxID=3404705 RepID=UPI003CEBB5FF
MKRETVKTLVLAFLIIVSLFFTWSIWTFQPTLDPIENMRYLENQPLTNEKREISEVVKPQQVFYHEGKNHYGADSRIDPIWTSMADWNLGETKNISKAYDREKLLAFIHGLDGQKKIELVFSQAVPAKTFQSILNWNSKEADGHSFDRVIMPITGVKTAKVYFISTNKNTVMEVKVKHDVIFQLAGKYFSDPQNEYPRYFDARANKDTILMLPQEKPVYYRYSYSTERYTGEEFKEALFNNPSYVTSGTDISKSIYTDGSRMMVVQSDQRQMSFSYTDTNVKRNAASAPNLSKAMEQSVEYLNSHGGWTDKYVFFSHNDNNEVSLRMVQNGLPVFASYEPPFVNTQIVQLWGKNDIIRYVHPTFGLKTPSNGEKVAIENGQQVLDMLKKSTGELSIGNVVRVFPAYELSRFSEDQNVVVNPAWYAETKSGTYHLIKDPSIVGGGSQDGLE